MGKISVFLQLELDCSLVWFDLGNSGRREDHSKRECKVPSLGDEQSNFCTAREQGNLKPVTLIENLSKESEKANSQLKCSHTSLKFNFSLITQLHIM